MPDPILFIFNQEIQKWDTIPLTRPVYTIGRTAENEIHLDNSSVSRNHARLQIDPRGIHIMDLNSSNGVIVNGKQIAQAQWVLLSDGAEIEIGQSKLRLAYSLPSVVPSAAQPGVQPRQPLKTGPPPNVPPRPQIKAARKSRLLPTLISLSVLLICVCMVGALTVGALLYYPQIAKLLPGLPTQPSVGLPQAGGGDAENSAPTATPTETSLTPPVTVETIPIIPGGAPATDSQGAILKIPASSLAADQPASLESASLSQGMTNLLEQGYKIESLAYSVSAAQDASGAATLTLPAPSPDSRLAVLIDNKYAGVLDIEPQNGALQINPFLGAPLAADSYPTQAQSNVPNRYFVVTPKNSSSNYTSAGPQRVSLPMQAADPDGKSCITEFWLTSHCWRNNESTVYVFWESNVPAELKDSEYLRVIDMIKSVVVIMTSYNQGNGFINAAISKSNPVYIVIDPNEPEPTYSQKTGNVYLNWKSVATITGSENRCALAHELMHFTEDSAYNMSAAALSNPKAWWLEMAAENGSFMIDPVCIDRNLETYGRAVTKDNLLPLQSASLTWNLKEAARYIQALQVYVSLCEGGPNCALSTAQFVNAINTGSYPFDDASVLSAYQRSSKDMGLFLLGKPPIEANAGAHLPPETKAGGAFAEYIWMKATPNFKLDISDNGKQIQANGSEATVKATIAQGGEYPLWVSNGKGMPGNTREGYTAVPAMLKIDAGTKLWYMLDAAEPIFHDGDKELILGPLSEKLGIGLARVVAIAPDGPATLSAKVNPIDLSGDWMGILSAPVVTPINCPNSSSSESDSGNDNTKAISELDMLGILSGYGTYIADAAVSDGSHYIWQGALPEDTIAESEITVKGDVVEVTYRIEIPQPSSSSSLAALILPGLYKRWPPVLPSTTAPNGWFLVVIMACFILGFLGLKFAPGVKSGLFGMRPSLKGSLGFHTTWVLSRRFPKIPLKGNWARLSSTLLVAVVLLIGASWLSGCFGMAIWGTFEGTYTFKKLEYIDPNAPAASVLPEGEPVAGLTWKLHEGKADTTIDLFIEVSTTDDKGVESTETQECKMSIVSSADGIVGPADLVPPPDSSK